MNGLSYLLLKRDYVRDAAVDRISETSLSLETDWNDCVCSFVLGNMLEEFRNVACSENLVNRREVRRSLLGVKIGGEYAAGDALTSQELARTARSSSTAAARASATAHLPITYPLFVFKGGSLLVNSWLGFWDIYGAIFHPD